MIQNIILSTYIVFYNNGKEFKNFSLHNNRVSNLVNDKFDIQAINSSEIKLLIYLINNVDYKKIELFDNSTIQIFYNETNLKSDINKDNIASNLKKINDNSDNLDMNTENISSNLEKINDNSSDTASNLGQISTNEGNISCNSGRISANEENISSNSGQISTNEGNISSNLEKINDNKDDIIALQNSNIKAFYNLDKIFIYDIEKGYQTVNKDNHYHIFEKEIIYNFVKDSYLEIILYYIN